METHFLQIPENQSLPDFIMDMDSDKLSSTLFIHKKLYGKLIKSCSAYQPLGRIHIFIWYADDVHPYQRSITISDNGFKKWKRITDIDISGVEYNPTSSEEYYIE